MSNSLKKDEWTKKIGNLFATKDTQSTKVIKLLKKTALSNDIQECRKDGEMGTFLHCC